MVRKGISIGMWPVLLVVTVLGVTSLGIGVQFIYDLTGDLGANNDRESLNTLGERTQNKCDAVLEGSDTNPLVVESVNFNQIEELKIQERGSSKSMYQLTFPDQDPANYKIQGCTLDLTSDSVGPGNWDFTIQKQGGSSLEVEAEKQ